MSDLDHSLQHYERFFSLSLDMLAIIHYDGRFIRANAAWERVLGYSMAELTAMNSRDLMAPEDKESAEVLRPVLINGGEINSYPTRYRRKDGTYIHVEWTAYCVPDEQLIYTITRDMTAHRLAEAERRRAQEQELLIQVQGRALLELSTPLIPISDRILAMPVIGTVDTRRAQLVMQTLLDGISKSQAQVAIIDITGVSLVDTPVANALLQTAKAAQLLGTEVVLTGIRPEVAQTLVSLGVDLGGIVTLSTLQAGIAYATRSA